MGERMNDQFPVGQGHRNRLIDDQKVDEVRRGLWRAFQHGALSEEELGNIRERLEFATRVGGPALAAKQPEKSVLVDSPADEIAAKRVRFTAELTCLLCGRMHGSLDGGSSWPPRGEALLCRPGGAQPTPVTGWWRLRCTTCGGALMATEITCHSVRPGATMD
jgi:hypothetical protein